MAHPDEQRRSTVRLKGSYTVEAALLMTLILPLLVGIIYLGYYLHDQAVMENGAWELTTLCMRQETGEERNGKEQEIRSRLLGTENVSIQVNKDNSYVTVLLRGSLPVPGLAMRFLCRNNLPLEAEVRRRYVDAGEIVIRTKLLKELTEEEDEGQLSP